MSDHWLVLAVSRLSEAYQIAGACFGTANDRIAHDDLAALEPITVRHAVCIFEWGDLRVPDIDVGAGGAYDRATVFVDSP